MFYNVNSVLQVYVYSIFSTEIDSIEKSGVNKMKGTIKRGDEVKNVNKFIKKIILEIMFNACIY